MSGDGGGTVERSEIPYSSEITDEFFERMRQLRVHWPPPPLPLVTFSSDHDDESRLLPAEIRIQCNGSNESSIEDVDSLVCVLTSDGARATLRHGDRLPLCFELAYERYPSVGFRGRGIVWLAKAILNAFASEPVSDPAAVPCSPVVLCTSAAASHCGREDVRNSFARRRRVFDGGTFGCPGLRWVSVDDALRSISRGAGLRRPTRREPVARSAMRRHSRRRRAGGDR